MKVTISHEDLLKAPVEVHTWLVSRMGIKVEGCCQDCTEPLEVPEVAPEEVPEAAPEEVPEAAPKEKIQMDFLRKQAIQLTKQKGGTARLAAVLQKLGISKVSECPDDKMADLLAAITTEL